MEFHGWELARWYKRCFAALDTQGQALHLCCMEGKIVCLLRPIAPHKVGIIMNCRTLFPDCLCDFGPSQPNLICVLDGVMPPQPGISNTRPFIQTSVTLIGLGEGRLQTPNRLKIGHKAQGRFIRGFEAVI